MHRLKICQKNRAGPPLPNNSGNAQKKPVISSGDRERPLVIWSGEYLVDLKVDGRGFTGLRLSEFAQISEFFQF